MEVLRFYCRTNDRLASNVINYLWLMTDKMTRSKCHAIIMWTPGPECQESYHVMCQTWNCTKHFFCCPFKWSPHTDLASVWMTPVKHGNITSCQCPSNSGNLSDCPTDFYQVMFLTFFDPLHLFCSLTRYFIFIGISCLGGCGCEFGRPGLISCFRHIVLN